MTPITKYITLINEIAEEMKNGDEIIWEQRQIEMRWCWKNTRTGQERFIRVVDVRSSGDRDDIRFQTCIDFIQGRKNAFEARRMIEKLPKLKAFL